MMVEVTQADKDIAGWFLRRMSGYAQSGELIQRMIATHRIQSTAELQAKLDKVVEALENIRDIEKPVFGEQPERYWLAWYSTAMQMAELAYDALNPPNQKGMNDE